MRFYLSLTASVGLLMSGCFSVHTRADKFLVGYSANRTYETRVPLILMWEEPSNGVGRRRQVLVVPDDAGLPGVSRLYSGPRASDPWGPCDPNRACWNASDVVAVIPAGTTLVVEHVERTRGWNVWYGKQDDLVPFARLIANGLPTNAEISDASHKVTRNVDGKDIQVPGPDPEILREVDTAP